MSSNAIVPHSGDPRQYVFKFGDFEIRAFADNNGDPMFIASDVCKALDQPNVSQVTARLDDDERGIHTVDTPNGPQQMVIVNESGLYSLILTSRKPEAKTFKRWITHEVIPAIRKTGSYSAAPVDMSPLGQLRMMVTALEVQQHQIDELREKQAGQAQSIEAINSRLDNAEYFSIQSYCHIQGIQCTSSVAQMWGKQASALSRAKGIQIREIATPEQRWGAVHIYHQSILTEVCVAKSRRPPGQLPLLKE